MSELEIKELQDIQAKITHYEYQLKIIDSSKGHSGQIYQLKLSGHGEYKQIDFKMIPGLDNKVIELLSNEYTTQLNKAIALRESLILCERHIKSVYKPIDILDKE